MPGKPKDPNKRYSPNWGGQRLGTGNKPGKHPLRLLKIACSDEELAIILDKVKSTRQRTEILLTHIERINR